MTRNQGSPDYYGAAVAWHSLSRDKVLSLLSTDPAEGLSGDEVASRQRMYGKNELRREKKISPFSILAKQFASPLIAILLGATVLSAIIGEILDAVIIMIIVAIAAIVSFVQEYRSERAIEELKRITSPTAAVIRNGSDTVVRSESIVPGDIISVAQGDRVPADAYLLESHNLQVNEAPLTGESVPVEKIAKPFPVETPLSERLNMIFSGTTATFGRAKAAVVATARNTELGKIATSVESVTRQRTPFEARMSQLGRFFSMVMMAVVVMITILGVYRGNEIIEMLVWGTSVAVAAIPEALPAVIATSLTVGVYKMAKKNAIVRRLPAVETLGAVTVVCSDKTGTLTTGQMAVRRICVGDTIDTPLSFQQAVQAAAEKPHDGGPGFEMLARAAGLCNDVVTARRDGKATKMDIPRNEIAPEMIGDPTEVALAKFSAESLKMTKQSLDNAYKRVYEIPFSSERKMMTTVHRMNPETMMAMTKGAPESIIRICSKIMRENGEISEMRESDANRLLEKNAKLASEALRVLALAFKELDFGQISGSDVIQSGDLESGMIFLGLVGIMDPPRPEAVDAIAQCRSAGVRVIMITGDNRVTAEAIAREIGIIGDRFDGKALTGADMDLMSDEAFQKAVSETEVFARVLPEHKLRITRALQKRGQVVAMTGDGVNDAPSLKAADIGIAMGITGTQVAKESSSMILSDDNFATIVSAMKEGRKIMDNVRKYLVYLLSANIGEIILFSSAMMAGLPMPLLAKHILYINLATDGSPAIALAMEPAEPDVMKMPPVNPKSSIFKGTLIWLVGVSVLLGGVSLGLFWYVMDANGWTELAEAKARTMVFGLIIFFEIFFAYSSRSFRSSSLRLGLRNKALLLSIAGESALVVSIMTIPALRDAFSLVSLESTEWLLVMALSPLGFAYTEVTKAAIAFISKQRKRDIKRQEQPGAFSVR